MSAAGRPGREPWHDRADPAVRQRGQAFRPTHRAERHQHDRQPGRDRLLHRPERHRQVDAVALRQRARSDPGRTDPFRGRAGASRAPLDHRRPQTRRHDLPALQPLPASNRAAERDAGADRRAQGAQARRSKPAPARCSNASACRTASPPTRPSSPAASSSASPSPAPYAPSRACWPSTSRPRRSIPKPSARCWQSCATWRARGAPCSWSPTKSVSPPR